MNDKKFFDIDEMMVDYAEMTSFDFNSSEFKMISGDRSDLNEYSHQPYTFKYGNFDILDSLQTLFFKPKTERV